MPLNTQMSDASVNAQAATLATLCNSGLIRVYDGILSAATYYATSSIPKFAAEGQYAVNARDRTWATLYTFMAEVQAGTKPMPAGVWYMPVGMPVGMPVPIMPVGFLDLQALLPVLEWPV